MNLIRRLLAERLKHTLRFSSLPPEYGQKYEKEFRMLYSRDTSIDWYVSAPDRLIDDWADSEHGTEHERR